MALYGGSVRWNSFAEVSAAICRYFTDSGAEREDFMQHLSNIDQKRVPKTSQMEPKGCRNEPRNLIKTRPAERERKREEKGSDRLQLFGSLLGASFSMKNPFKKPMLKINRQKT